MNDFLQVLSLRLQKLQDQQLHRVLRRIDSPQSPHVQLNGASLLNFSSNDYLGLATHPATLHAASEAALRHGAGSGASRLISGSLAPHHDLEESLADFKGTQAALTFSTGYATTLGIIPALLNKNDFILVDRLVHASIVDAARLSGATLRVFRHLDLNNLESILKWAAAHPRRASPSTSPPSPRILIVTESLFSMDGDVAPLREIVDLKERYGAWLMVDEAHATGLYGDHRRGLVDEFSLSHQVDIQMGTLGKALGSAGGYVCGSRTLIDFLINTARSFIFSTAPVPAAAAAARAAIALVRSNEGNALCDRLWARVDQLRHGLTSMGIIQSSPLSPIIPLILGQERRAITVANRLQDLGFFVPAVRFPTVPHHKARIRLTLSATHSHAEVQLLLTALRDTLASLGESPIE
jgi:8-amino-7-oxononanoate synthase